MMIRVKTVLGEFTLVDGKFTEGSGTLEKIFDIAMIRPIRVWEGPVDFAIARRMVANLPKGGNILEQDHPIETEGPN